MSNSHVKKRKRPFPNAKVSTRRPSIPGATMPIFIKKIFSRHEISFGNRIAVCFFFQCRTQSSIRQVLLPYLTHPQQKSCDDRPESEYSVPENRHPPQKYRVHHSPTLFIFYPSPTISSTLYAVDIPIWSIEMSRAPPVSGIRWVRYPCIAQPGSFVTRVVHHPRKLSRLAPFCQGSFVL